MIIIHLRHCYTHYPKVTVSSPLKLTFEKSGDIIIILKISFFNVNMGLAFYSLTHYTFKMLFFGSFLNIPCGQPDLLTCHPWTYLICKYNVNEKNNFWSFLALVFSLKACWKLLKFLGQCFFSSFPSHQRFVLIGAYGNNIH